MVLWPTLSIAKYFATNIFALKGKTSYKHPALDTKPKDPFPKERVFDFIVIYLYYITSLH